MAAPKAPASSYRLDPLLKPAQHCLGWHQRETPNAGLAMVEMACIGGFAGSVHLVNPKYRGIAGRPCHASLADLPERVEHVVLGLSDSRLEVGLREAIAHGARAVTIFASCTTEPNFDPAIIAALGQIVDHKPTWL